MFFFHWHITPSLHDIFSLLTFEGLARGVVLCAGGVAGCNVGGGGVVSSGAGV